MSIDSQEIKNKQVVRFLVDNRYRFLRHAMLLLGLLALLYYSESLSEYSETHRLYRVFSIYIVFIVMFYVNMYVLVPSFFFNAMYLLYLVLLTALVLAGLTFIKSNILNTYLDPLSAVEKPLKHIPVKGMYEGTVITISIMLVTTTVKLLQRWTRDNERIAELRDLTQNMELKELKNQINPHFLFNMLNNVKAMIRIDPDKATTVIIKLSEFLRYQLYENNEEKTLLVSEMNFLSNFMNLEKIRRDNLSISMQSKTDVRTLNSIFVPPNLFTTFVENAVKHSVDATGKDAYISISIEMENKQLHFISTNSKSPDYQVSDKKNSGLGLINIKRRLELLYQGKHHLNITSTDNEYTVDLIIPV